MVVNDAVAVNFAICGIRLQAKATSMLGHEGCIRYADQRARRLAIATAKRAISLDGARPRPNGASTSAGAQRE